MKESEEKYEDWQYAVTDEDWHEDWQGNSEEAYQDWQYQKELDEEAHIGEDEGWQLICTCVDGLELYQKGISDEEVTCYEWRHPENGTVIRKYAEAWDDDTEVYDKVIYNHYVAGLCEKAEVIANTLGKTLKCHGRKLFRYLRRKYYNQTHVWWHNCGLHTGLKSDLFPKHMGVADTIDYCHKGSAVEVMVKDYGLAENLLKWGLMR